MQIRNLSKFKRWHFNLKEKMIKFMIGFAGLPDTGTKEEITR